MSSALLSNFVPIPTHGDGLLTHNTLFHRVALLVVQCLWEGGMFT